MTEAYRSGIDGALWVLAVLAGVATVVVPVIALLAVLAWVWRASQVGHRTRAFRAVHRRRVS